MNGKLNQQKQQQLEKVLRGALVEVAATFERMLGGEIRIHMCAPAFPLQGVGVQLGMTGALEGGFYLDLPEKLALELVKRLTGTGDLSLLDETARSALMEFGNILASVFVGHFDQHRGLRSLPTPPKISLVPLVVAEFAGFCGAELRWSSCQERAQLLIGLGRESLDILLD